MSSVLLSPLLQNLPWIEHGFGTRHAVLSQDEMASLLQTHSSEVLRAEAPGCAGEGDALITNRSGVALSIRTADCFPILLADVRTRAVAAVHAGWRGTAAKIVQVTLRKMRAEFGTSPSGVLAAIGPGIGVCCYQVGEEVGRQFGLEGAGPVDLLDANRRQLIEEGVPQQQIGVAEGCTYCEPQRYFSYRREREQAGRMISFIRLV